ncbi:MAG: glycosyl transferase family 1 [Acidobacteriota bacterium]
MRILHVVPSYAPAWRFGGPIRAVHGLAKAQVESGDRVEVFTTDAGLEGEPPTRSARVRELDGVRVTYFPRAFPRAVYRAAGLKSSARKRIREFDLVHLHSVFLWPTLVSARVAERVNVPYLISPRGMLVEELIRMRGRWRKEIWIRCFERRTLRSSAAIVATSEVEATELRRLGLDTAPIKVVPNGIEVGATEEATQPAPAELVERAIAKGSYVLYLGRLSRKKNLDLLVAAVAGTPDLRLLVAGSDEHGERDRIERLVAQAGLEGRVEFLGEIVGAAKERLLGKCMALVLVSVSENFGNVVVEALAAGRPVVVTPTVGSAEIVRSARAGHVVEHDVVEIAAALRALAEAPEEATRSGQRGREYVARELSWRRVAERMNEVYSSAIGPKAV